MIVINKAEQSAETLDVLMRLSKDWEDEDSCRGYKANSVSDIEDKEVFLLKKNDLVAGFLLCHQYKQEKYSPTVPMNAACLEIDEIYIIPSERSKGLGKELLDYAIAYYSGIDYATLSTATKNYQAILHFYIDEVGFTFWSARLFKKLK